MARRVETKNDVMKTLYENRLLFRSIGVRRLGLFGSFVREQQSAASDVDILVEFEEGQKTFDHFRQWSLLLEELLCRPMEVVTPESLSPYLGPHILREVEYVPVAA